MSSFNEQALGAFQDVEDRADRLQDALTAAEVAFGSEMIVAFTETMRKVPSIKSMQLPCITGRAPYRETTHCAEDMVQQLLVCDNTWAALERLIRESDCPHAAALRRAMAADHIDQYAEEIAALRVER